MNIMVICLKQMNVLAVCETQELAFYWADILCPKHGYHVDNFSMAGFDVFSEPELRQLYTKVMGKECPSSMMNRDIIVGSILNMEQQLLKKETIPELKAKLGREPLLPVPLPGYEGRVTTITSVATPRAPGNRQSGVRDTVFEVADKLWTDAGSPSDKGTVLKLRKLIMDKLESEGVKRTTASGVLGAWHIERAPY